MLIWILQIQSGVQGLKLDCTYSQASGSFSEHSVYIKRRYISWSDGRLSTFQRGLFNMLWQLYVDEIIGDRYMMDFDVMDQLLIEYSAFVR